MLAATDDSVPGRHPVCRGCGYPYSGQGLCSWCRSVDVLTSATWFGSAAQAEWQPKGEPLAMRLPVDLRARV